MTLAANPGDVILLDSRLLHSTFPNSSSADRSLLSTTYFTGLERFSDGFRAKVSEAMYGTRNQHNSALWAAAKSKLAIDAEIGSPTDFEFDVIPDLSRLS